MHTNFAHVACAARTPRTPHHEANSKTSCPNTLALAYTITYIHTRIRTIAKPGHRNARSISKIAIIKKDKGNKQHVLCKIQTYCPNSENHPSQTCQETTLDLLRSDTSHRCQHILKTNQLFSLISQLKNVNSSFLIFLEVKDALCLPQFETSPP